MIRMAQYWMCRVCGMTKERDRTSHSEQGVPCEGTYYVLAADAGAAIAEAKRDMLAKFIAAVEAVEFDADSSTEWDRDYNLDPSGDTRYPRIWIHEAVTALRSLQDQP